MVDRICSVEDCAGRHVARGMCSRHYRRWQKTNSARTCSVNGCNEGHYARGWCFRHYDREHAKPDFKKLPPKTTEERFWSYVEKTETCWNWAGSKLKTGYGALGVEGTKRVHRYAYELLVGPIPRGMHIDHTCFNRLCVNPDHLRAVTQKQNNEHQRLRANNTSGFRGVHFEKRLGKWIGTVGNRGKLHWCGAYDTPEQANEAVIAKRNEVFTHNDLDRGESVA